MTAVLAGMAALLPGCKAPTADGPANDVQMATYVKLVMPARIEIQRYLTKPVSLVAAGDADGIEAILAAYDAADDLTKVVGTFQFELQTRRLGEHIGERVAFWPVQIDSNEAMRMYRDHLSRFYRFPLQLDGEKLAPGRYILIVRLQLPDGRRLLDEYEFSYDGQRVAPPSAR